MKPNIKKDIWLRESIEELIEREFLSPDRITIILTESIIEYFSEKITFEELVAIIDIIQNRKDEINDKCLLQKIEDLSQLSQYMLDEEENSEQIYNILKKSLIETTDKKY